MENGLPVKTAGRVFEVVEALVALEGAEFSEIVDHLEMPRSTVHDHLQSLETIGLVSRTGTTYSASLRFLEIGELVRRQQELYKAGHEQATALATELGEHAGLMVEERGYGVLLFVARGEQAVDLGARGGLHLGLTNNAPGKAILAHLPRERRDAVIDEHGLTEATPESITDRETLEAELDRIREQGYATETSELVEGVRAVAAPVISRGDVRGAIAVGGPRNRMRGARFEEELPDKVLQASNVVELNLSYG